MPQQNIFVARMNRTLMEKTRSMLTGEGLEQEFWEEVVNTSCFLVNKLKFTSLVKNTPYEEWDCKNPSLKHLKIFGHDAFEHVPKEKRRKLDNKSKKCIFNEYKDGVKGYKFLNLVTRKTIYS